eukprot:scaffold3639_cov141-Isochrysis_galbana.AAC.2
MKHSPRKANAGAASAPIICITHSARTFSCARGAVRRCAKADGTPVSSQQTRPAVHDKRLNYTPHTRRRVHARAQASDSPSR